MVKKLAALALPVVIFAACSSGPGDPEAACHDVISTFCSRLYQCNDSTTIQKTFGFSDENDCVSQNEAKDSCSTAGCPLKTKFQPDEANTCLNEIQNQACNDTSTPVACTEVCQ